MNSTIGLIQSLGAARLAAMGAVSLILIGFFAFIMARVTTPQMAPLYTNLSFDDSGAIVRELESMNMDYSLKADGGTILVPRENLLQVRMRLAEDGLPSGGSVGYEIFDKSNTLGATSFVQNLNHLRALEGELSRTISSIAQIKSARVHLVIPERELFKREAKKPSASIILNVRGTLGIHQVSAIQHIVATAVEGLQPTAVSIVDNQGRLLASGSDEQTAAAIAGSMQDRTHNYERTMQQKVEDIVTKIVGQGRTRVEVAAQIDFNRRTVTSESFDPEGQVVRAKESQEETTSASSREGNNDGVTVGNELPGEQGQDGEAGAGSNEERSTVSEKINYEIPKTTTTEIIEGGNVQKISVAVLVDGSYTKNAEGIMEYQPRSQEQLDQISALVKSAVGFDAERGDVIEVINQQFAESGLSEPLAEAQPGMFDFTKEEIFYMSEMGVMFLISMILIFFVLRPLLKKAISSDRQTQSGEAGEPGAITAQQFDENGQPIPALTDQTAAGEATAAVASAGEPAQQVAALGTPGNHDLTNDLLEKAQKEGSIHINSIKQVSDIIEENPKAAVNIVRDWINEAA